MAADGSGRKRSWLLPWRRRPPIEDLDPGRSDLVVVAAGFDDAEASSAALDRGASSDPRWTPSARVVLRHHLLLPAEHVDDAIEVAAQDGYRPAGPAQPIGPVPPEDGAARPESSAAAVHPVKGQAADVRPGQAASDRAAAGQAGRSAVERARAEQATAEVPDARVLVLQRVQVLDALHCSQERSRMAGLAQRRNGLALGWEALQPLPSTESP